MSLLMTFAEQCWQANQILPMSQQVIKVWAFRSDSHPDQIYQTLQWSDGKLTCNCPGWTRRSIRQCKHTRSVELGTADEQCVSNVRPKNKVTSTSMSLKEQKHAEVRAFDW